MLARIAGHVRSQSVGYLALFVALGGGAYAASSLPDNSVGTKQLQNGAVKTKKLAIHAVTGAKVANSSLTGKQIKASTLGTVPNAAKLGGSPASAFRLHCPRGYTHAAHADLCFEFNLRPAATYSNALKNCAGGGGRLPDPGELAVAFDNLGVPQDNQRVAGYWFDPGNSDPHEGAMYEDTSRKIFPNGLSSNPGQTLRYRCVSSPSN